MWSGRDPKYSMYIIWVAKHGQSLSAGVLRATTS